MTSSLGITKESGAYKTKPNTIKMKTYGRLVGKKRLVEEMLNSKPSTNKSEGEARE